MAVGTRNELPSLAKASVILAIVSSLANVKCPLAIVVPSGSNKYTRGYGDLIVSEVREYARLRQVQRATPCLLSFVETYFDLQPSRIPVLLPENSSDNLEISRIYLTALQTIRSTYVYRGQVNPSGDQVNTRSGLIITEDPRELSTTRFEMVDLCGRDCKYLVVPIRPFSDDSSFLELSEELAKLLWERRIASVAFLGVVGHEVLVSRSLSFKAHVDTQPSRPVLVAGCDEDSAWSVAKWEAVAEVYTPLKMNRSIVNVAYFNYEPYVTHVEDKPEATEQDSFRSTDNTDVFATVRPRSSDYSAPTTATEIRRDSRLSGFEGLILNNLASAMNFAIVAKEIVWSENETIASQVNEALWGKNAELIDMVLGGLIWDPEDETEYTLPYDMVQFVWLIPIRPNVSLHGLVAPLDPQVWLAVLALLVFASCVQFVIARDVAFLEMLSLVIGVSWPRQPTVLSSRIRFISWVIFGYVLTQFYLASLAGLLMATSDIQIETLKELADSSYEIGGLAEVRKLFEGTDASEPRKDVEDDSDSDSVNDAIKERFNLLEREEYAKFFDDLIDKKNTTFALAVRMNISSMTPSFQGKHVHRMREALASYPLSFAVWRGMPYLSELDRKISNLVEGGIIGYWGRTISRQYNGYYSSLGHEEETTLTLLALVPGFLLLLIGYGISGICLIAEIVVFGCTHRPPKRLPVKRTGASKERSTKRNPRARIDGNGKKATIETLDAKTWILGSDARRGPARRKDDAVPRIRFPVDFLH